MSDTGAAANPALDQMVQGLSKALGSRLHGVVLYGSAARGDFHKATSDLNLIVVLEDLEPATLAALEPAFARWRRLGQPTPRIFSPGMIADSADVFPVEFLDIRNHHVTVHGSDPFRELEIHLDTLRLQCEKELREKMMRLREGYVEAHRKPRRLERLLAGSYPSFAALFRGCLHLLGGDVPQHNDEVVAAFCRIAALDPGPFEQVARLKQGMKPEGDPHDLFLRYYDALTRAVRRVDRFALRPEA